MSRQPELVCWASMHLTRMLTNTYVYTCKHMYTYTYFHDSIFLNRALSSCTDLGSGPDFDLSPDSV